MPVGLAVMAAMNVGTSLLGMNESNKAAKKQEKLAKEQAKIKIGLINENYVAKMNNLQKDYALNFYDRNSQYAHALQQVNNQEEMAMSQLAMSTQGRSNQYTDSSYFNDMKAELAGQYETAIADTYSTQRINELRGAESYAQTREQERINRVQNIQMAQAQMDANLNQINATNRQAQMNGMFNIANTAVNFGYQAGYFQPSVPQMPQGPLIPNTNMPLSIKPTPGFTIGPAWGQVGPRYSGPVGTRLGLTGAPISGVGSSNYYGK